MTTLDPSLRVRPIAEVTPGSFIKGRGRREFCARHPSTDTRSMVIYDPERAVFMYNLVQQLALDFGDDLIIVPNLKSHDDSALPSEATTELFLIGDSPKIVFVMAGGANGLFQLDLKTGAIEPLSRSAEFNAFREWTVGVNTVVDGCLPLLAVRPREMYAHQISATVFRALAFAKANAPSAARGGFVGVGAALDALQVVGKILAQAAHPTEACQSTMSAAREASS